MLILKKQKGQSAVEFAVILPIFMITALGLIQLGLIYENIMMLKYTAYMTARVAIAYTEEDERDSQSQKAVLILKAMQATAGAYSGNIMSNALDGALDALKDAAASYIQGDKLLIEKEEFKKAKGNYIKVTVTYNMPLKIPFVNKIFGMFQNKNKWDIFNARTLAAYGGFPYYTLKSSSIMRVQ